MHELHAADKILNKVISFGENKSLKKILSISLDLGVVIEHGEEINPRNLRYNFESLSKGTIADGAKLEIKKVSGNIIKINQITGE
jgi:Zn finger protein HypA/HybF involved in hydrogenase expression